MKCYSMRNAYCVVLLVILIASVLLSPLFPTVAHASNMLELQVNNRDQLFTSLSNATWRSSDTFVASVNSQGVVVANGVGIAEIAASSAGQEQRRTVLVRAPKGTPTYNSRSELRTALANAAAAYKERLTFQFSLRDLPADNTRAEATIMSYFPSAEEFCVAYCRELQFTFVWIYNAAGASLVEATCTFSYASTAEVAAAYRGEKPTLSADGTVLKEKSDAIIQELGLRKMQTRYERVLAVHDYIVKNSYYHTEAANNSNRYPDSFSAFGVLVQGKGVCQGYAEAMKLLLNAVDVKCDYVVGFANEDHAWNRVQLDDGNWYNVDATWNDPLPDIAGTVNYDYFCVTDAQLAKTHEWTDYTNRCNATTYSYPRIAALLNAQ